MKPIYLLTVISFITLTACKKEYTCSCTYDSTQQMYDSFGDPIGSEQTTHTSSSTKIRDKKDAAKTTCEGSNGTIVQNSSSGFYTTKQTVTTNCTLQ